MPDRMHLYIGSGSTKSYREQDVDAFLFQSLTDYLGETEHGRHSGDGTFCVASHKKRTVPAVSPAEFIRRGPYGKPYFTGEFAKIAFSISHSGRFIAVLFAGGGQDIVTSGEIGLDIEDVGAGRPGGARSALRLTKIADRFFTPEEAAYVREDPPGRFFRIWTGKESYIKYTGRGLGQGLDTFSVLTPPEGVLIEEVKMPAGKAPDLICSRCCSLRGGEKDVKIIIYD
jgi:4'-phosphopantetheinyl transferase